MRKHAFEPINPQFSGKKWGVRILLFLLYFSILSIGGTFSAIPDTALLTVGLIGAIVTAVLSIPIFWLTRNMFQKRHLQYGFYLIVILVIGGRASTMNAKVESEFLECYQKEVLPGLKEMVQEVQEGDIPYTNREEAGDLMREKFPKYWSLWEQMRQWSFIQTTSGILMWPLLLLWGGSLTVYKRKLYRWSRQTQNVITHPPTGETIQKM